MKILYIFISYLILFYGCSKESNSTDEWVEVSFYPSIEYIITPLNGRSNEQQQPDIVGLIYSENNLVAIVTPENNEFSTKLKMGQYYTALFVANGAHYLKHVETISTAQLTLDTLLAPNQFGSEIYLGTSQVIIRSNSYSPVKITLNPIVNVLAFIPDEIPTAGKIKEMTTTLTNICPTYYFDKQDEKRSLKTIKIKTSEKTDFKFSVYTFSSPQKTHIVSEINRYDNSSLWDMGSYYIDGNKYYHFTGELK